MAKAIQSGTEFPGNGYLNVIQASEFLGVHPTTLRDMSRAGRVPSYKLFNRLRFRKEDLDSLIKPREVQV